LNYLGERIHPSEEERSKNPPTLLTCARVRISAEYFTGQVEVAKEFAGKVEVAEEFVGE